jgi:hypothetical protein
MCTRTWSTWRAWTASSTSTHPSTTDKRKTPENSSVFCDHSYPLRFGFYLMNILGIICIWKYSFLMLQIITLYHFCSDLQK